MNFHGIFHTLVLLSVISFVNPASILCFFGISSYSHRIAAWPLIEALASRGHDITFLSPYPAKNPNPNVKDFVPKSLKDWVAAWNESTQLFDIRKQGEMDNEWYSVTKFGISMCEVLMTDPAFKKWIQSTKFDLVIIDALVNECAYAISYAHKAKVIIYNTAIPFPWYVDPFGFSEEASWVPDFVHHYAPGSLGLFQRAMATFNPLYFLFHRELTHFPALENIIRSNFLPDFPSLSALERNTSLLFINQHWAEDFSRPFPPNVVTIPGIHSCLGETSKKNQSLPTDLQEFLKGEEPVIYMSFGSYMEVLFFPEEKRKVFFDTLSQLKGVKVVWKFNAAEMKDLTLPPHIYTAEWLPQKAILAHPNVRMFITHGGLLGIQEAVCAGVPLLAFPIFAEQDYNAEKIVWRGIGEKLEVTEVTVEEFRGTIQKVLANPKYRKNIQRLSKRFQDLPMSPLEKGVWWTEYVLRHDEEDLAALRPLSVEQPWWKRRLLDVWFLTFLAVCLCLGVAFVCIRVIFKCAFSSRKEKVKVKRN